MVKKGDRVNSTNKNSWAANWQNCEVLDIFPYGDVRVRSKGGLTGILPKGQYELVPKPLTDQELADKYRALRKEAQEVGQLLIDRGYKVQGVMAYGDGGWVNINLLPYAKYRFIKTVTTTEEI